MKLFPLALALVVVLLETVGRPASAAEDPKRFGDAAGLLGVAQIYCDGRITNKAHALFAEMRKLNSQAFTQGVFEGANALARILAGEV